MIIKKGTQVRIITGKDRGKTGEILEIDRKQKRVKIKSINMIKKHLKPTKENKGGIIYKEGFINQSNIRNIVHIISGEMLQKSDQSDYTRPRRGDLKKKMCFEWN